MYGLVRTLVLRLLRAPTEPPDPPAGSRGAEVRTFRASKKLLTVRLVALAIPAALVVSTLGLVLLAAWAEDAPPLVGALVGVVLSTFLAFFWVQYLLIRLDFDMRYYLVTDRGLRVREGALVITEHTFTFANIQNLTIEQGPLERLLGIANLRVQTAGGGGGAAPGEAGGGGHGGTLRGIDDAEALRDELLVAIRRHRDAGLGDEGRRAARTTGAAPSARFVERLREVRDEVRALGRALEARGVGSRD